MNFKAFVIGFTLSVLILSGVAALGVWYFLKTSVDADITVISPPVNKAESSAVGKTVLLVENKANIAKTKNAIPPRELAATSAKGAFDVLNDCQPKTETAAIATKI